MSPDQGWSFRYLHPQCRERGNEVGRGMVNGFEEHGPASRSPRPEERARLAWRLALG